jgi:hypothetical protein
LLYAVTLIAALIVLLIKSFKTSGKAPEAY